MTVHPLPIWQYCEAIATIKFHPWTASTGGKIPTSRYQKQVL
jgi:hypothetical protein